MAITLYPHQEKAIRQMRDGCVLVGGVGTGKSLTAVYYYEKNHKGKDVYVITTAKKKKDLDWVKDFAQLGISEDNPKQSVDGVKFIVASWNKIQDFIDVENAFFIFDEQRLVGSGAWVKGFLKIAQKNQWIMLSGTPGDTYMEFIPLFVANGFYKNRTEFIRRHVVFSRYSKFPKVERYVETDRLEKICAYLLVDMPYTRHTIRHLQLVPVDYDKSIFDKAWVDRWHVFEERPIRDVGELFIVIRKIVNSHQSRIETTREIYKKHKRLIIFYNFNYELDALRDMCEKLGVAYAEWNGHKHEKLPDTDAWIYLVQYTAGAEGWNCISTDATLFYSLNYSYKIFEQAQGRIDRLNTKFVDLYYYVLISNSIIDKSIWKAITVKKNFNKAKLRKEL